MSSIALTDRDPILTAAAGTRIPRRAWSDVNELTQVLAEAKKVLHNAQAEADALRRKAQSDGYAAGAASAQAQSVRHILDAQRAAREFVEASEQRIITLATAIVMRIAPALGEPECVAALAAEALRAIHAERHLRISVTPQAVEAARSMLTQWHVAHPEIETAQVAADPDLEPFDCVVESELGRIEAGLPTQLAAVREGLTALVEASER